MANPVQGIQFTPRIQFKTELQPLGGKKGPSFADALRNALNDVSGLQEESQRAITAFVNGEPVELHQVMAAAEEASISLEFLIQVRNKLTEAYRTVMSMQ